MEELEPTNDFSSIKPEWQKAQVRTGASQRHFQPDPKRSKFCLHKSQNFIRFPEGLECLQKAWGDCVLLMGDVRFPKAGGTLGWGAQTDSLACQTALFPARIYDLLFIESQNSGII